MVDALEIRVLGPFEVSTGGRPVAVTGGKRDALLALLALRRGRVVTVEELVDALWGADLPAAPRNAVQHHVARLRASIGHAAIVAAPDGYALADARVDALQFEELLAEGRAALREGDAHAAAASIASARTLYRGASLQGLTEMPWFAGEARRLEGLRVDALEEQFEAALALGDHREIVSELRATLEENPFRERLWGQLMLALYRSGRQADALQAFQEARSVLAEELGLEPGPDLKGLQEAILAQDPAIAAVPLPSRHGNLPSSTTSFVGRDRDLAEVVELLRGQRLVTLIGPPGVGKSRLALEAARLLEEEVVDGVWLVEVARAGDAYAVIRLLAQTVDARGPDPLARVLARLRDADALVVLDACEHALAEAAELSSTLLAECRHLRVLATSREALHLVGEVRLSVEPLPVGDPDSREAADSPAVQLFAARARAARPNFKLTPDAASLAADIARRVDGLPLAIELAAARVNVLGLAELHSIVERRLALLKDGIGPEPSLNALRGLVEWSYELLHRDEKTLLHQLAVHRGGASLPSLLAVAANHGLDGAMVTYLLQALVDKSIVLVSFPEGEARYDLLDTVREYAIAQLEQSGGLPAARKAHAEHFATLADGARTGLRTSGWQGWMAQLEREHDNLWAALTYAQDTSNGLVAARLAVGLGWYFGTAERVSEGREFTEAALELADEVPLPLRIELLANLCYLATEEEDLEAAVEIGERALGLAAQTEEAPWETALARLALAFAYDRAGPAERAVAVAEEARRRFDDLGDRWGAGSSALTGAVGALTQGDIPTATALIAEAVRLHADYDVGGVPAALIEGWLAEQRGEAPAAAAAFRRALELSERAGFAEHASFALTGLGSTAFGNGDVEEAEAQYRRALEIADAASASWLVAHAKARLAQVLETAGDTEGAATLYRDVLAWCDEPRRHEAREALFIALAGSPATPARRGLAALGS